MAGKKIKFKDEEVEVSNDTYVLAEVIRENTAAIKGLKR